MRTKRTILCLLLPILMISLVCCKTNIVLSPKGTVAKRKDFSYDAYGGYISIQTTDSVSYSGELIGLRNDSLVVLADSVIAMHLIRISKARIIVYSPNKYGLGLLIALPNFFLFGIQGEEGDDYGGGPAGLAVILTAIDAIGVSIAMGVENKMINYFDWSGEWNEILKYSRFPYGIPPDIRLLELRGRTMNNVDTK